MNYLKKHPIFSILLLILCVFIYLNFLRPTSVNEFVDKNDSLYVNDLYQSNGFAYHSLNLMEQKMYLTILNNIKKYESSWEVNLSDYNCSTSSDCILLINTSFDAILVEHPELINYATYSYKYSDNYLKLNFKYAKSIQLVGDIGIARIKIIIDDIKKDTKIMTDEEKIIYVYNWIGKNTVYDNTFTYSNKNQSIFNVFLMHNAVCAGFAKASTIIFQNIGIESYAIVGVSTGPHMWNVIKYNDKYYYFDSTVAASIHSQDKDNYYDGLKQEYLNSFSTSNSNWYPQIEKTNMNLNI